MNLKIVLLSVVCFAFFIQPAHSGQIVQTAIDSVGDLASIGTNLVKTKASAIVRGVTDMGSILTTGLGLKIRALARASGTMKEGAASSVIAVGDTIRKAGDNIAGGSSFLPIINRRNSRIMVEAPVVREVVEQVKMKAPTVVEEDFAAEPEVVETAPIRSVQLRVRQPTVVVEPAPRILDLLKSAAQTKLNLVTGGLFNIGGSRTLREPVVYEIVESPREFRGPLVETFQVKNE